MMLVYLDTHLGQVRLSRTKFAVTEWYKSTATAEVADRDEASGENK